MAQFADEQPLPPPPDPNSGNVTVGIASNDPAVSPDVQRLEGGAIVINLNGRRAAMRSHTEPADSHDANLAEYLEETELRRLSSEILDGINADLTSREEWLRRRADGLKHLALQLENPRSPSADSDTAVEGQSTVRSPILLDAVMRFQANARGELLPAAGPVKVTNWATPTTEQELNLEAATGTTVPLPDDNDMLAEALEKDLNWYLTVGDKVYYPDTNRMFFMQGYGGCAFKKVYVCPLLRRPVARAVDAADIIVSDNEVSLHDCGRVTHRISMRQSVFRRMQIDGIYVGIPDDNSAPFSPSAPQPDALENERNNLAGFSSSYSRRPADYKHVIYECYCEYDLAEYGHTEKGAPEGLPLPYRVTIDKDSQRIVEIRRGWKLGDDRFIQKMPIVKWPFVDGMSFYGVGLLGIMGNSTAAVSAAWRLALDSACFSSWPGFVYTEAIGRQDTMSFRVPMGGGVRINSNGAPIRDVLLPLPYKDVTTGLVQVTAHIEEEARRVGGTAELAVGEGRADVPVGTTLAMMEQAMQVLAAVHKGMHIAQAEEFSLLRDLFAEDPTALICNNPNPARKWETEELIRALKNCNLTPQSDPNTPSHTIRLMKAVALVQLVTMNPKDWNLPKVYNRVSKMVGLGDVESLLAPPSDEQAPTDPKIQVAMLKLQGDMEKMKQGQRDKTLQAEITKMQDLLKLAIEQMRIEDNKAERASREKIEAMRQSTELVQASQAALVHPDAVPTAETFIQQIPAMIQSGRRIL
jgi:hypothetical protein